MLHLLDNLLRHLFMTQIDEITDASQVGFQPPDESWRSYVAALNVDGQPVNALNVYLFALNEHRALRSNEKVRHIENGMVSQKPAPFRMECHYLITAWSPAGATPAIEPTLDEHALLYKASAAIINKMPLNPTNVYERNSPALQNWPEPFRDTIFPTSFLPVDDFTKMAEFWTSMGEGAHWKPALRLMVTLPVEIFKYLDAPMVTQRVMKYYVKGGREIMDVFMAVSGQVRAASTSASVPEASVSVEDTNQVVLHKTQTDEEGRFAFVKLGEGDHKLRVSAGGFKNKSKSLETPGVEPHHNITLSSSPTFSKKLKPKK